MGVPFNHCRPEYAESSIRKGLISGRLVEDDAVLIRSFCHEMQATVGITVGRTNKIVFTLVSLRRFIGPFAENTIQDLHSGIIQLRAAPSSKGKPFKANTIADHIAILKQFYTWLVENGHTRIPAGKLAAMITPARDRMTKTAGDLLTPEEVAAMVKACMRDMDRALLITLYEGGFRIGEMGALRWGDITFDTYGCVVNTSFKTKKPRYVRLIMAVEHLGRWRESYPGEPEGDALVFVNRYGEPLNHGQVLQQFRRIAARAGIRKNITPHLFRHSRITHLIREGASESVIKMLMWGSVNSRMLDTYLHLVGADVDREIFRLYNIDQETRKGARRLEPRLCAHCQTLNGPTTRYCTTCLRPLEEQAAAEMDDLLEFVRKRPEYQQILQAMVQDYERITRG